MKKRIISLMLSIAILLCIMPAIPVSSEAADFATQLRSKGFTESYITKLVELHKKYPNWNFEPLITNEDWTTAVAQERTPHSQQLIQRYSGNDGKGYYCADSTCYRNGNYIVHEGSNWVAASQTAVEYYMDPRNFLDEKYIFQFESTAYDASHSVAGVETILSGTWMHNANITYKNAQGRTVDYSPATKYSAAIMAAAKNSGLSAYYLASKIVQEVGGRTNSAGGASGTNSRYPGIYNYYNIGAYTGALDGLKWAATSSSGYTTNANSNLRKSPTTNSSRIVLIPNGTKLTYNSQTQKQSDGHIWYNVTVTVSGKTYTGYIRSDLVNNGSDKYNRPWTNPYLSIYNGAVYIANNFGATQYTGYLQKFNVNPASGSSLHSHEYMANVQAAASESLKAYNGYKSANLLSQARTFSIPVYKNMPNDVAKVSNVKVSLVAPNKAVVSYNKVSDITGYDIQVSVNNGSWTHYVHTTYLSKEWEFQEAANYQLRVRTYTLIDGYYYYNDNWSDTISFSTKRLSASIPKVQNFTITNALPNGKATVSCAKDPKASGYQIQIRKNGGAWTHYVHTGYWTKEWAFEPNTDYQIRMRAYDIYNGKYSYSSNWSEILSFTTKNTLPKVTNFTVTNILPNGKATVSCAKDPKANGYQIQIKENGSDWKHYVHTGYWTKEWNFKPYKDYQIRMRSYYYLDGKYYYSSNWSDTLSFSTKNKLPKVSNFTVTNVQPDGKATVSCTKDPNATGYQIQIKENGGDWKHYVHTGYWTKEWNFDRNKDYQIRMRSYYYLDGKYYYSSNWSDTLSFSTKRSSIPKVTNFTVTSIWPDGRATVSCARDPLATGYQIQIKENGGDWKHYVHTGYWTKEWTFEKGKNYLIRMRAYDIIDGQYYYSNNWSDTLSFSTKRTIPQVTDFTVTNIKAGGFATVSCARDPFADGYQIQIKEEGGDWKHYVHTGYWTKEWTFTSGRKYQIRMRAYDIIDGQYAYSPNWSDTLTFTAK